MNKDSDLPDSQPPESPGSSASESPVSDPVSAESEFPNDVGLTDVELRYGKPHEFELGDVEEVVSCEHPPQPSKRRSSTISPKSLYLMTFVVEGGMLIVAIVLGWLFSFHAVDQPLASLAQWPWLWSLLWGTLAALPLFFGALMIPNFDWGREYSQKVEGLIKPLFSQISILGLIWISIMAGLCEEMMFRWFLQGGLEKLLMFPGSWLVALLVASIVFGVMHWIDRTYVILATIAGLYLGGLMLISGTVLVPIVAHVVYDFLALYWITRGKTIAHT